MKIFFFAWNHFIQKVVNGVTLLFFQETSICSLGISKRKLNSTQKKVSCLEKWPLNNFDNANFCQLIKGTNGFHLELVSKELNHFGVIADLFRQIGGHTSRLVLFCSFWRLFTIKMIKSVKVFPFSFWKIITIFFYIIKFKPPV